MTISVLSMAQAVVSFAWWTCVVIVAVMVLLTVAANVSRCYDKKDFWPREALRITVLGKAKQWFHMALLLTNICCALWLVGCYGWTWWTFALTVITFPLSGIILTWLTRFMCVLTWLVAKGVEKYLRIFRWF